MSISEKDIKLLWGRSANRCAFHDCRIQLSHDKTIVAGTFPIGHQAHIVAEKAEDIRGKSPLSLEERNSYYNLILLCPTHHTLIDKDIEDYPVERLHMIKATHEFWVERTLSNVADKQEQAYSIIYSSLIDAAVECCQLYEWHRWTSRALRQPPIWSGDASDRVFSLRQKNQGAIWSGKLPELEQALKTLDLAMSQAFEVFSEHSSSDDAGDILKGKKFYQIDEWNPDRYQSLLKDYNNWLDGCANWIFTIAKAANWLADVVRRDINPLFFAEEGKFTLFHGPYMPDAHYKSSLPEYTSEEKALLPGTLEEHIASATVVE